MKKIIIILLSIITILSCLQSIIRVNRYVYIDYNEGWNAFFAEMAIEGEQIYQAKEDLIQNNYPPISFYIVGFVGRIIGDTIIAGRLLSIFGILLTSFMASLIIYHFTRSYFYGIICALLIISYMGIFHSDYFGMNDPHWIAQSLMMAGLTVFIIKHNTKKGILISIILMIIAGFTKHSFIAIPIACTLWLWLYKKEHFSYWIITLILLLGVSFVLLFIIYGEKVFLSIFLAPRTYSFGAIGRAGQWLQPTILYLVILAIVFIYIKTEKMKLLFFTIVISLFFGLVGIGGGGVYVNVLYETILMAIIISVIGLSRIIDFVKGDKKIIVVGTILLLFPIIFGLPSKLYSTKNWLKELPTLEKSIKDDIQYVSGTYGEVICENLALQYWSGKKFIFDFFSVGQKLKTNKSETKIIENLIKEKKYTLIQLDESTGKSIHLPNEILSLIKEYYKNVRVTASGLFLLKE